MRICAAATEAELEASTQRLEPFPVVTDVRPTESGLVMLRGRIGGSGAPFNLGEATVTRAAVRLGTGETGFSYLLGRSKARARLAAILDAAGQNAAFRVSIEQHLVHPVTRRLDNERRIAREEAAATRVEFFTLVRGED
jgi:alpha-D-ribose 1-methylphosphonate 5-triphosphate synthase subunit PhnG